MKFGIRGQFTDVITCFKFLVYRFRGYVVLTPQNCLIPLTCCVALTTVWHYRATLWCSDLNSQPKQPGDLDLWPFESESGVRVTCDVATSAPILVFLFSVLDLGPMYATDIRQPRRQIDRRQTKPSFNAPPIRAGHNNNNNNKCVIIPRFWGPPPWDVDVADL